MLVIRVEKSTDVNFNLFLAVVGLIHYTNFKIELFIFFLKKKKLLLK